MLTARFVARYCRDAKARTGKCSRNRRSNPASVLLSQADRLPVETPDGLRLANTLGTRRSRLRSLSRWLP